ncbi:hypothetical protein LV84_02495 [Algoriphagus ratkowskyi]|uniref:Four-helix bundle copper-binding protein n=1 Tax=Algoriphagus ratkowskyi TaxID=57028 RepID=A0A2W7RIG1_9BACT|nr:hypothetical protein [Algoriphagus ratkowskyi]PZX55357.1 hypothetical protein LV84_02495 [Algoriphagus ratkowskyi]TXD79712.1 hypothetical protein ESW18_00855 [Algoriphagus ratkowskyi]
MKTPTQENSLYLKTLQQCIKDCELIISTQNERSGMERCIELSKVCIVACNDCLVACESVGHDIGSMLQLCVDACKSCAEECKKLAGMKEKKATLQPFYSSGSLKVLD